MGWLSTTQIVLIRVSAVSVGLAISNNLLAFIHVRSGYFKPHLYFSVVIINSHLKYS
jgi:hypothetical protein